MEQRSSALSRWDSPVPAKPRTSRNFRRAGRRRIRPTPASQTGIEEFLSDPQETRDGLTDEDAVPDQLAKVVTVTGDVWILGDHRLLCGDTTQMANLEKVLSVGLADM